MDAGGAGTLAARPLAAPDRLVVRPAPVARASDDDVVHRPLALGRQLIRGEGGEGGEDGVGDPIARLDVAGDDRRGLLRVDEAAFGGLYLERSVRAGVRWDVLREEDAQGEVARRAGHRELTVHVAAHGTGGAGEVDRHRVALYPDGRPHWDVLVGGAVAFEEVLGGTFAVGEVPYGFPGALLGVGDHLVECLQDQVLPAPLDKLADANTRDIVRGDLGAEVAAPQGGGVDVCQEEVQDVLDVLPTAHETDRRDDDAFLVDLPRIARHAPRPHTAHVRVVRAGDGVAGDLSLIGYGGDEGDVRQVGPAGVGIVYGEDVAGFGASPHHRPDGLGHRAEMDRDVLGLGDHPAPRVEEGRRAVTALLYVRGVGAPDQDRPHLLGDPAERAREHGESYRIHALTPSPARASRPRPPAPASRA